MVTLSIALVVALPTVGFVVGIFIISLVSANHDDRP
jgi:hypothetical protein